MESTNAYLPADDHATAREASALPPSDAFSTAGVHSPNNVNIEGSFESAAKLGDSEISTNQPDESSNLPQELFKPNFSGGSIRIHLIIKSTDIGFEALYKELQILNDATLQVRHVKRALNLIALGQSLVIERNASVGGGQAKTKSFPIIFRLSDRDTGLDKVYNELCAIEGTSERNHHVKRCLFNAYSQTTRVSTNQAVTVPSPSPILTPSHTIDTPVSPWATGERLAETELLTPAQSAVKRANKRKMALSFLS